MNLTRHIQHERQLWSHFKGSYISARLAALLMLGACVFCACQSLFDLCELCFGPIRFTPDDVAPSASTADLLIQHVGCAVGAAAAAWLGRGLWRLNLDAWFVSVIAELMGVLLLLYCILGGVASPSGCLFVLCFGVLICKAKRTFD